MPQHDFNIDNQSAPAFRGDLNNALEALATLSSGGTAPSTTYANMLWYDTSANILKMRSEADDAWIDIGTLNQSTNVFEVANVTNLVPDVLNATGPAPVYACRAWVNFEGTAAGVPIRGGGNVSSITDNGVGRYTVNLTIPIQAANYSIQLTTSKTIGNADTVSVGYISEDVPPTTSSFRFYITETNFANSLMADSLLVNVAIFQ